MTLERDDTALKLIDEIIIKKVQPELVECLRDAWVGSHFVKGLFFQNLGYVNGKVVQLHQDLERYNLITLKSITFLITVICRLFKVQNVKLILIDEIISKKVQAELVECLRDAWVDSNFVKCLFFRIWGMQMARQCHYIKLRRGIV